MSTKIHCFEICWRVEQIENDVCFSSVLLLFEVLSGSSNRAGCVWPDEQGARVNGAAAVTNSAEDAFKAIVKSTIRIFFGVFH